MKIVAHISAPGKVSVRKNGFWLPGVYDSMETAKTAACDFTRHQLLQISEKVCGETGEDRSITMVDLEAGLDR